MQVGNVTIDPLSKASPVEDPAIVDVIDLGSGEMFKAVEFIAKHRYDELVKLRVDIQDDLHRERYRFACAWCSTPAYIVASHQKNFFFRHIKEDGSCAAHTRGMPQDEILARKYHGQRESEAHKRVKSLIERSLLADASFSTVAQEKTWRAARDLKARRQPDVQAVCGDLRLAFEVQLSTTFLSVVAGRRQFYRKEGGLLVWILASFTPEYRRMTTDDLLFSNNSNILVVDDETTAISERDHAFHVRSFFRRPLRDGKRIVDQWEEQIVRFDALVCDRDGQRAYFFDFEGEERKLADALEAEERAESQRRDDDLRQAFWDFWHLPNKYGDYLASRRAWDRLRARFNASGIRVPAEFSLAWRLETVINAVLSAKDGRPVGWKYKSLVEVAHLLENKYKDILIAFGYALKAFGHHEILSADDKSGKWKNKQSSIRDHIKRYDPDYIPDDEWVGLVGFLFPDIREPLEKYAASANDFYATETEDI